MCWHRNVHVSFKQMFGCENYQLFSNREHGPLQGPDIGILKWHQGLSKLHCWWSLRRKEFQKVCEEIPNIVQISDCKKSSGCKMECAMSWHECQTFECLTCGSLSYGEKVILDCLTSSFFFFFKWKYRITRLGGSPVKNTFFCHLFLHISGSSDVLNTRLELHGSQLNLVKDLRMMFSTS